MNRQTLLTYISTNYAVDVEYLWKTHPNYAVFRHSNNRKWFVLIADVERHKIGLEGSGRVDLMNLKAPPELIDSLRQAKGFLPAYHMNKEHWISLLLDGSVSESEILELLDLSFQLTG
ncbi:MmcQ/YjbR family DNA-binding protein [Testudinibacter sp. P27/CKL/0425]